MKIFVSHSSQQDLLVQAIKERLPPAIELWIDGRDLAVGDQVEETLEHAVRNGCDLFMPIVDKYAAQSDWVRKELSWALAREQATAKSLLLPVVLDEDSWHTLVPQVHHGRKYLRCADTKGETLNALVIQLINEVVTWLIRERSTPTAARTSVLGLVREAEDLQQSLSTEIRTVVHPFRRARPLAVADLARHLVQSSVLAAGQEAELPTLLERMRQAHLLEGMYFDSEVIYLTEERYTHKSRIYQEAKRQIAKVAVANIESGSKIAIDGGSTTLEVARRVAQQVRAKALSELEIFTNSLPAAAELLETLNELDASDRSTDCRVSLLGGWCRPISMTSVPPFDIENRFAVLPEKLDISFVGTNGLFGEEGVAVKHQYEGPTKSELLRRAKHKVVLADPSKLLVQQNEAFGLFSDGLEIITARVEGMEHALERMASLLEGTPSTMKIAE